jgi:hypothetical protein
LRAADASPATRKTAPAPTSNPHFADPHPPHSTPPPFLIQIERIRTVAQCASALARAGDDDAAHALAQRMTDELTAMPVEEAMPLTRACG